MYLFVSECTMYQNNGCSKCSLLNEICIYRNIFIFIRNVNFSASVICLYLESALRIFIRVPYYMYQYSV